MVLTWEVGTLAARNGRRIMVRKSESAFVRIPVHKEPDLNMRRRGGQLLATDFDLATAVDQTGERNAKRESALGVSDRRVVEAKCLTRRR